MVYPYMEHYNDDDVIFDGNEKTTSQKQAIKILLFSQETELFREMNHFSKFTF